MSLNMSSHRSCKRSHSREKSHDASTSKLSKRPKSKAKDDIDKNDHILRQILQSVTDLKADMSVCNSRITALEAHSSETASHSGFHFRVDAEHEHDALSVSAGNDIDCLDASQLENMATKPPNLAIRPPDLTIKSPEITHESRDMDILTTETDPELVDPANEHYNSHLYDPDDLDITLSPSEAFISFLEKNFC